MVVVSRGDDGLANLNDLVVHLTTYSCTLNRL
jgi:hypothetical protein